MVNTILARRVNHIVAKGDSPAWPKGSKSRGFSSNIDGDFIQDSVKVAIPISSKVYEDSTYTAYVSGYRANLDSIFVYPRREVITITDKAMHKRWSIGIQAGYGFGRNGLSPYIGIGISYNLLGF